MNLCLNPDGQNINPSSTKFCQPCENEWLLGDRDQSTCEVLSALNPQSIPTQIQITLTSEKGIDYSHLQELLAARKWQEADQETYRLVLKVANREKEEYLTVDNWLNFPCKDLHTIDQLWVQYSYGRFGFSVQKEIWESKDVGGHPEANYEIRYKFANTVGWRKEGNWLAYSDLTFNINAPIGHLPVCDIWLGGCYISVLGLFSSAKTCNL